jgi:hypothetical protein
VEWRLKVQPVLAHLDRGDPVLGRRDPGFLERAHL